MSNKTIDDLRKEIFKQNPNDYLLGLNDETLLQELYYGNTNTSNVIRNKYKTYNDWENSIDVLTKSSIKRRQEKELVESPYNTQWVKSIADKPIFQKRLSATAGEKLFGPERIGAPTGNDALRNLAMLRMVLFPESFREPSIIEGIGGDTQNLIGTALNWATLGQAKGPIGQSIADLGTLNKQIAVGPEGLEVVRIPTPGKSKPEFKYTEIKQPDSTTAKVVRGIGGYMIPFTGALKATKAATQATKFGKQLSLSRPKLSGALQLYGATAVTDQLYFKPEEAMMGKVLQDHVFSGEASQDILEYVTAGPEKTQLENRVALLFDSIFMTGAIGTVLKVGGFVFRKSSDLFKYAKNLKEKGTPQQKKDFADSINSELKKFDEQDIPKDKPKQFVDDIEQQEIKFNKKIEDKKSWTFSESDFARGFSFLGTKFFLSRGSFSPRAFFDLNMNKNAAIAIQNRGVQIQNEIDTIAKKLVKGGQYTADDLNEILKVYMLNPKKSIDKLLEQKVFTKQEFDEFIKQRSKQSKFTADDLPVELKELADEAKNHIEDMQRILYNSDYISPELKKEIANSYGAYLRQSYKKFINPNYKPSQEVFDEAVIYITKQLQNNPKYKGKSEEQLKNIATIDVKNILKEARYADDFFSFVDTIKTGKTGDVLFKERQKLADEIANLLGVENKTSSRIFFTMSELGQFISRQKTAADIKRLGEGKYLFSNKDKGLKGPQFDTQIKGRQYGALDGMWTTREFATNFLPRLADRRGIGWDFLKGIYSIKGFAQATKTVGNNITHLRNFESSAFIVASNGINPVSKTAYDAVKVAWSNIKPTDNKIVNDLYNEYLRLGIVNQNAKLGDITRLINEANKSKTYNFLEQLGNKSGLSFLARQANKAYVAEDDIWKIVVYENELATLKKAYPDMAKNELERLKILASNKTRNTMPTYDMIPDGFKVLRYSPFGNYFSFHAERFRNTYHTYRIALEEIKSGNPVLKSRGYKRLASQITIGQAGSIMVASSSMYHSGVSREEDIHIKNLFKRDYHGDNFIYDIKNDTGELSYADIKFTDPSAPVNDVVLAPPFRYLNDDNMTQAEYEDKLINNMMLSVERFLKPFADTPILYDALIDVIYRDGQVQGPDGNLYTLKGWDNKTKTTETKINNFYIGLSHVFKQAFMPVVVDNVRNTILINKDGVDKFGVTRDPDLNRFRQATGQNYNTINKDSILKRVQQEANAFNRNRGEASRTLYQNVRSRNATIATIKKDYLEAQRKYYFYFSDLNRTVNSALRLPEISTVEDRYTYTKRDVKNALKESNIGEKLITEFTLSTEYDRFIPLEFSEEKMKELIENNPNINKRELEEELNTIRYTLMDLPLLDVREEYDEYQIKALNVLYEREKRFEGGPISLDFPVTDVKETAADRVDPFTGQPYSDQMDRLGFASGGLKIALKETLKEGAKQSGKSNIPKPIKAYHGSGKDFDKFEKDFLKTGEGINAYGRGIYFAESKPIANFYRNQEAKKLEEVYFTNQQKIYADEYRQLLNKENKKPLTVVEQYRKNELADLQNEMDIQIESIISGLHKPVLFQGKLYEVNLYAKPNELLNWDKTIKSQPKISPVINDMLNELNPRELYKFIHYKVMPKSNNTYIDFKNESKIFNALLKEAKNISLTDQSKKQLLNQARTLSKNMTGQEFFDKIKLATSKNPSQPTGSAMNRRLYENDLFAEDFLEDAGIKGVMYNDAMSRSASKNIRSKNYVIYDTRVIQIAKAYSISIPVAAALLIELSKGDIKQDELTTMQR